MAIDESVARSFLARYGPIARCTPVDLVNHQELREAIGGMWVEFAYFSDCRDALNVSLSYLKSYYHTLTYKCEGLQLRKRIWSQSTPTSTYSSPTDGNGPP